MIYQLLIERSAQKALAKIPQPDRTRIIETIQALREAPRPAGTKKLSGRDAWRVRVGTYRILYEIQDHRCIVCVVHIAHRREVYRR